MTRTHAAKATKRRATKPATNTIDTSKARSHRGTFAAGNRAHAQLVLLDGFDVATATPWLRPFLVRAQMRYRGFKLSGLVKRCGQRMDGLLRAACVADAVHDALTTQAATMVDVSEARALLADARTSAREARTTWLKVFALVGVRRGDRDTDDPLAALARELASDDDGSDDDGN